MLKSVHSTVWAFDCEWVPDPQAAQNLLGLHAATTARECMQALWARAGATPDDPEPYLKPVLCRVVSVVAVQRVQAGNDRARLTLTWLPRPAGEFQQGGEADILRRFLGGIGRHKPQLVGYNSQGADLKVLAQRALVHGLYLPGFGQRPDKPWEGADYHSRGSDFNLDLMDLLAGSGRGPAPTLGEWAALCGFPGKPVPDGLSVAALWLDDRMPEIVERNVFGAVSTYLLWLRTAHLAGFFDDEAYAAEQESVEALLSGLAGQGEVFATRYLAAWSALRGRPVEALRVAETGMAYGGQEEVF